MNRKTLFIIGIVLVSGAMLAAVAVAQNTGEKSTGKSTGDHECTPDMMDEDTVNHMTEVQ